MKEVSSGGAEGLPVSFGIGIKVVIMHFIRIVYRSLWRIEK